MRKSIALGLLMLGWLIVSAAASAQEFPFRGHLYLSFDSNSRVSTRNVAPGEIFQLWLIADVPSLPANPEIGIAGVEGSVVFPPSLAIQGFVFLPSAIDLGPSFPEPDRVNFIVGLGVCRPLGAPDVLGVATAQLLEDASNVEIAVAAPSVGAASVSSFNGDGPGWAAFQCDPFQGGELYLFERPSLTMTSLIVNPTAVPVRECSFSRVKALY